MASSHDFQQLCLRVDSCNVHAAHQRFTDNRSYCQLMKDVAQKCNEDDADFALRHGDLVQYDKALNRMSQFETVGELHEGPVLYELRCSGDFGNFTLCGHSFDALVEAAHRKLDALSAALDITSR